jgi:predicted PurR-regulated permease PerM
VNRPDQTKRHPPQRKADAVAAILGGANEVNPKKVNANAPAQSRDGLQHTVRGGLTSLPKALLPALLLGGLALAAWAVVAPFVAALAWAVMIAYASWPLYAALRRTLGGRETLAAGVMTLLGAVVLFAPLMAAAWAAQQEAGALYRAIQDFLAAPPIVPEWFQMLPAVGPWLNALRAEWLSQPEVLTAQATEWFKARIGDIANVAGQIGKNLGKMFIALIALFFVYRDWERLSAQVRHVLAGFLGERAHGYLAAVSSTTRAVVYGLLLTALVQGTLAGLGYWAAGVSAPILLGLITTLFAMVPFATPIAWGGVGLWLLIQGEMVAGVGVLLWGALVVSQIDNFVRPLLISAHTNIPFLLVLLGVPGGVLAFGLIGLFLGPIVLTVLLAVWREWADQWNVSPPMASPTALRQQHLQSK